MQAADQLEARSLSNAQQTLLKVLRVACLAVLALTAIRMAWIGDDALITLRVALNVTHGWGPGFNATESVMAYTHPLWFLMWSLLGSVVPSWIAAVFFMSLVFSIVAMVLVVNSAKSPALLLAGTGALLLSSAFIDYTSSGLETPLAYVLVGVFVLQVSRPSPSGISGSVILGLTIAGIALTRLDLLLVIAPVAAVQAWTRRNDWRSLTALILGFASPMLLWLTWSWTTYQSFLPNTFLAKTNLGIPRFDLVAQGLRYLAVTGIHDLVSVAVIVGGSLIVVRRGNTTSRLLIAGMYLYLGYVVWVGGDFMTGRFLAVPVFLTVLLALRTLNPPPFESRHPLLAICGTLLLGAATAALCVIVSASPTALLVNPRQKFAEQYGIVDERGVYAELGRGLNSWLRERETTGAFRFAGVSEANPWESLAYYDRAASSWPSRDQLRGELPSDVGVVCWLGGTSIMTGPTVHWIDTCALADRFLAESPARPGEWRVGHYKREIPQGYVEAVRTGNVNSVVDPLQRDRLFNVWSKIRHSQ